LVSEPLLYLTYLAVIFILGIILNIFSDKFKIPNAILLLAFGILVSIFGGAGIISSSIFISSIGLLALVMVIFDAASRFRIKEIDKSGKDAVRVSIILLLLNLILLPFFVKLLFGMDSIFLALAFAALMSGTSFSGAFLLLKHSKGKVSGFLHIESIINTLPVVLLPFIFIALFQSGNQQIFVFLEGNLMPVITQIIAGVGAGIIIGLIFFKFMRKSYSASISPIATVAAALIAYVLAENMGGNGVLAVAALGLFFGNVFIKAKEELQNFSFMFITVLEIFVFIILALMVPANLLFSLALNSFLLFILLLLIRFASIDISLDRKEFTFKEKLFMALNSPKGIAEAVVAIAISSFAFSQVQTVIALVFLMIAYSVIVSAVAVRFKRFFS
jgi:cell volume regulation protein A